MSNPSDIEQIKTAFEKADKGGGGKITRDALKQVFKTLESDWTDADLKDLFDLVDTEGNGFIQYDAFVNYIMQDDGTDAEEEDTDEANADAMEQQAQLARADVDTSERIKRKAYIMLATRLGEDDEEAADTFDAVEREAKEDGEEVDEGVPLSLFLHDLHIEPEDNEAMEHLRGMLEQVRAKLARGQDDEKEKDVNRPAMFIGIDRLLRHLIAEGRPAEDAWKAFQEGKVPLSKASRGLISSFERRQDELIAMVKDYKKNPPMLPSSAGQTGNREATIKNVTEIIDRCKAAGSKFTDPEWDMTASPKEILYVDRQKPGYDCTVGKPAGYKRLTELIKGEPRSGGMSFLSLLPSSHGPVLFRGGIRAGDIVQGQIGTCFLLGAIGAVVSNNPENIKRMFIKYDIDVGVYGIRFNVDGEWVHVVVDDYMPVDAYGNLLYAKSKDPKEIWVALLEKAYCKLHTCYEMCDGGRPGEAIFSCFGGASGAFSITKKHKRDARSYFNVLSRARERGWLLTTGFRPPNPGAVSGQGKCGEAVLPSGLVGGHVYSVLKLVEHKGTMLVQCRNPWGTGEWTGKWSDRNANGEWTEEFVKACDNKFQDDGKFWMDIEDFVADSTSANFARVFGPQWKKITHYSHFNSSGDLRATAQWAYKAGAADEISFDKGEEIDVLSFNKGWWYGHRITTNAKKGFFPGNYVRLNDRRVTRFDLAGKPAEGQTSMTVAILLMMPNSAMKRKFYRRKEDGLNYKDCSYPRVQLVVVGPDGQVVLKKEGCRRELSGDVTINGASGAHYKIYCSSVDGLGGAFVLRAYVTRGTATMVEAENAHISEVAHAIGAV